MPSPTEQYRPSFSLAELEELVSYLPPDTRLYKKLSVYLLRVNVGLNSAAYVSAPKLKVEDKLGFTSPTETSQHLQNQAAYQRKLETKVALGGKALMSDEEKYNWLAAKAMEGSISEEEKEEGRALELKMYQMNMGMFV